MLQDLTQETIIYLKSTIETREKNHAIDVVLVSLLLTLNIFHTFFSVSIVEFEQVNVFWE